MLKLQYNNRTILNSARTGYVGFTPIAPVPVIEWDVWDRSTYNDTSWQSTLTTSGSVGTVTISTASQFINFGALANQFYADNSLSELNVNLTKHFRFNDTSAIADASTVYSTLSSSGVKSQPGSYGYLLIDGSKVININGNGHVLQGMYCYIDYNHNAGSFCRVGDAGGKLTINQLTFDRCLFRSNSQASSGFSMINGGAKFITNYLNFNKCAIASESNSSYQALMFGFLNNDANTEYYNTQISFYNCGFKGYKIWNDYSCGCGGISNWSSTPKFKATWNNTTYISPFILGGNGTMKLYSGYRAISYWKGNVTYYNVGAGITAQGKAAASSEADAISTFNSTVTNQDYTLVFDANGNLYHKCEI